MKSSSGREPPTWLIPLLNADQCISARISRFISPHSQRLSAVFTILEYSCHGVPVITLVLCGIFTISSNNILNVLVNLLIALILDILVVALLKAYFRRRRPSQQSSPPLSIRSVDQYSFPSGHASRSVLLALMLTESLPPWSVCRLLTTAIGAWTAAICLSRVLMRRHSVLDVAAGIVLGWLEYLFLSSCAPLSAEQVPTVVHLLGGRYTDDMAAMEES